MLNARRLALILAAQACAWPVVAWAQPAPAGQTGANANAADDEDEEDEEDEAPAARASTTTSTSPSASASDAEAPRAAEPPETAEARRTRLLPRYSALDGSTGLLHTASAQLGSAGSFRFGLIGEYWGGSEFLRPLDLPGSTATGADSASHVGGTVTLSYAPLDFLEIYGSVRAYANSNTTERPTLFQTLGDGTLGIKAGRALARGFYLGGDIAVWLLNRSGDIGLLGDSTSANFRVLSSLNFRELTRRNVPLHLHFNVGYFLDNSAAVVSDVESRRRAAQPGFDPATCSSGGAPDPRCYLEVTRGERFALGVNRQDRVNMNLGLEAELPFVRPFVEWQVGIPVNRQGYQCYDAGGLAGPGGASDDDGCLANVGFSALPSTVTLGARILPPVRGVSALLAFDIGTSGTSTFVRELSPTLPWNFYFGAAFAYDTHPVERRVEVPVERVVTREVDRTPPGGHVNGLVRDAESRAPVPGAIVTFTGRPNLPILASGPNGRFLSGHLTPGDYAVQITAPDYNAGECRFTIPQPPAATPAPGAAEGTTPTPALQADVDAQCDLRPMPRRGGVAVHVVSSQGGAAVANANVVISPAPGFNTPAGQQPPTDRTVTTDSDGRVTVADLLAGSYTVRVEPSDRHMAAAPQPVTVQPRQNAQVDITAPRRPARASVAIRGNLLAITRQVHFQTNSAEILPDSNTLLAEIADVLQRHPEITSVDIQGHTDNTGTPAGNMTLSQNRADSVRTALINLGISADRLVAHGLGQTRPLRPNLTAAGRTANRRVEFHITRTPAAGR